MHTLSVLSLYVLSPWTPCPDKLEASLSDGSGEREGGTKELRISALLYPRGKREEGKGREGTGKEGVKGRGKERGVETSAINHPQCDAGAELGRIRPTNTARHGLGLEHPGRFVPEHRRMVLVQRRVEHETSPQSKRST